MPVPEVSLEIASPNGLAKFGIKPLAYLDLVKLKVPFVLFLSIFFAKLFKLPLEAEALNSPNVNLLLLNNLKRSGLIPAPLVDLKSKSP